MFKTNFVLSIVVSSLLIIACGTRNTGSGGTPVPPPPAAPPTTPVATGDTPQVPNDHNHPRPDDGRGGGPGRGDHGDHDGRPDRDNDHDRNDGSRAKMQILDIGKLMRIATNNPDRPDFYAIEGRIVPARAGAMQEMRRGATGCYTQVVRQRVRDGQVFDDLVVRKGLVAGTRMGFFMSVGHFGEHRGSAVAVTCLKAYTPVSRDEMVRALRGIVRFVR